MEQAFFDHWSTLERTLAVGVSAYVALILFLRIAGKRVLSKMNAFDLVITVSLGSTLATILLNRDVSWAQGSVALALLVGLQFLITWLSVRVGWVRRMVTGEPALLLETGKLHDAALRRERITADEVRAAIRSAGLARVDQVAAVVLETDGSLSVITQHPPEESVSSLVGVKRSDETRIGKRN
ncbi:DUF421 domain-containing protein [Synoicihabitans lomoniglobus]|uniref:DUF421 domain-containing protein n=1 Tax=Synoicihabitans lomoniglobus TaxID=2909285 RepID=A0AAE9ZVU2_9BACT|nr:DUF421 domain-containing protein [Opitutaceae bacterium LMO-M01]WED64019.1 DUF421 domain-containing protein [Opitutaceae bacterium LMO-M01]